MSKNNDWTEVFERYVPAQQHYQKIIKAKNTGELRTLEQEFIDVAIDFKYVNPECKLCSNALIHVFMKKTM
jgi:hypothetical protein